MAGAYIQIPLGRDAFFTSNVNSRLSELSATMVNANLFFLAKGYPYIDNDDEAIINVTPTANTTTNIVTVNIPRVNTSFPNAIPSMFWEISMLTASNLYYTLDQGRMAITEPVRLTVPA